jgi:hypothetical protein
MVGWPICICIMLCGYMPGACGNCTIVRGYIDGGGAGGRALYDGAREGTTVGLHIAILEVEWRGRIVNGRDTGRVGGWMGTVRIGSWVGTGRRGIWYMVFEGATDGGGVGV